MKKVKGLIIMLLISLSLFGMTACDGENNVTYEQITAEQAKTIMDTEKDYIIIDARTEEEFAEGALETGVPVTDGIVNAENLEQAVERCGTKQGNKGFSAMQAAIETVNVLKGV